jgi:arsenic resistance protein ArsH
MKAQIDHLPLNVGGMRPTQWRTLAVMQVSGGSQSFNAAGRMKPSSYYDRIVDVMEELVRFTVLLRPHVQTHTDHYSERKAAGIEPNAAGDLSAIATAHQKRGSSG